MDSNITSKIQGLFSAKSPEKQTPMKIAALMNNTLASTKEVVKEMLTTVETDLIDDENVNDDKIMGACAIMKDIIDELSVITPMHFVKNHDVFIDTQYAYISTLVSTMGWADSIEVIGNDNIFDIIDGTLSSELVYSKAKNVHRLYLRMKVMVSMVGLADSGTRVVYDSKVLLATGKL